MQLNWTQGGSPIARAIKVDAFDREVELTDTDRNFIRYVGSIPPRATLELTRRRTVDHDVVQLVWEAKTSSGGAARGRVAFFDVGPWIIGRLTNEVDALERDAV